MTTTPHTSDPGSDPDPHPHPDQGDLPVIRKFVSVPEVCYESPGGITIHDPTTRWGRHWIESDVYVDLWYAK